MTYHQEYYRKHKKKILARQKAYKRGISIAEQNYEKYKSQGELVGISDSERWGR